MNTRLRIGALALMLAACTHAGGGQDMDRQLDAIRVMIKQSALMAANAACGGAAKDELMRAAAAMNRRAMGGPEMAKIHQMMGMQPDNGGAMNMKGDEDMSPAMQRHVALHDAGEAVFDFLEAVGEGKVSCAQTEPVRLAADAAMLREAGGKEPLETAAALKRRLQTMMKQGAAPEAVSELVNTLGGI